ncbi:MAG: S9 family peptidase [Henriciella sp.]|nr:S9 family peptidase [Henriciella sp.]
MKTKLAMGAAALALLTACATQAAQTVPVVADEPPVAEALDEIVEAVAVEKADMPNYSAETFFQTTSFSLASSDGHAFSVDGTRILGTSDASGVYNAVAISSDGSVTQLTNSETDAHFAQSFFPNDDRILVTADQGGNELTHVYVRELDGTLKDLTPGENVKASFGGWHESGDLFYLWTNERDPAAFDLYSYTTDGYARKRLFENPGYNPGAISSDGRWAALDEVVTSADTDIHIVDMHAETPVPVLITEHQYEGAVAHSSYDFTEDSANLIYSTNEFGEFSQAWTYDVETGEKAPLIEADWDVSFVFESPSGRYQVSAINADALTDLTILDSETGEAVELKGVPEGELSQVRFSRDESRIVFGLNTDTSPRNLYHMALGEDAVRLTDALNPAINEDHLVTATVERFESFDGVVIPGILYKPKQASAETPVPAMVWVHGGPGGQSTRGYNATIQHLVNHGYAIYAANNRGSSGYGKTFFHMDDRRHGEEDLMDIVKAGDYLRGLDWIDADKVGVMGGSYGGYITAAALAFHPEEFDVGINIFGVTNWLRTLESVPPWWGAIRGWLYNEMGDPATDSERLRAISPLFHAENIVKPMLVVQGANDPRVLQVESDEIVDAVRANGVPVEYVVFPDEGHGFRRRENKIAASDAYVDFLDTYLKAEPVED